ncbi:MAG: 50S ribosomal protein L18 [Bacillota bacterium]|nr:50S ribosomal protein L18 [Bacillota bacterium]
MINKSSSNKARLKRHYRVRNKISGTADIPRINVFRSLKNMYVQLIDDENGVTVLAASTLDEELKGSDGGNKNAAKEVGKLIGKKALDKGIKTVVFDRSGYIYHGRVKEVADGAREAGLEF